MTEFYITFGGQYRHEPHPAGDWAHPDGYLVVVAEDYSTARRRVFELLGGRFAFMYEERPAAEWFPLGETKRVAVLPEFKGDE